MYATANPPQFYRMLQVQHFVEQDVLDRIAWDARVVEHAADYDGVVCRIVVSESAPGVVPAPGQLRTPH